MKNKILILAALFLFLGAGCVTVEKKVRPIEEENMDIVELKKAIAGLYMKSEEMNNRLFLLQEKADTSDERIDVLEDGSEKIETEASSELKVVKLKDEEKEEEVELEVESVFEEKVAESHSVLSTPSPAVEAEPAVTAEPVAPAEELYEIAMKDLKERKYPEARVNFQKLYGNYPEHSLADNAMYWTGETHYAERNYTLALDIFNAVVNRYPDGNKAADSMLKTAYAYISLKDRGNTIKALNMLMEKYPDSEAAVKANEKFRKNK